MPWTMLNVAVLAPFPKGQDDHHHGREPGAPPQSAACVPDVPRELVEPPPRPDIARPFADQGRVAQRPPGRAQVIALGNAAFALPLALELQMESELLLDVGLGLSAAQVGNEPAEPPRPRHGVPPSASAGRMTRPTASTMRSQRVASRTSWRRPDGVRA